VRGRPVYLIASPGLRSTRTRWDRQLAELTALFPGARLIGWDDLPAAFRDVPPAERPARLALALAAAVVVPDKLGHPPHRWIGRTALAEAQAFAAAGKPVHAYMAGQLVRWDECELIANAPGHPDRKPVELILRHAGERAA
jgi:hypothetical protein